MKLYCRDENDDITEYWSHVLRAARARSTSFVNEEARKYVIDLLAEWNAILVFEGGRTSYIEFTSERDMTIFLLRWS